MKTDLHQVKRSVLDFVLLERIELETVENLQRVFVIFDRIWSSCEMFFFLDSVFQNKPRKIYEHILIPYRQTSGLLDKPI